MPRIPYEFEGNEGDIDETENGVAGDGGIPMGHLVEAPLDANTVRISWPLISASIEASSASAYLEMEDIITRNPMFRLHGTCGYTIGSFSEFFVIGGYSDPYGYHEYRFEILFGAIEVTVGRPTPLGKRIFGSYHDRDREPEWEDMHSIRIMGVAAESAELYLLNALIRLEQESGIHGVLIDFPTILSPTPPAPIPCEVDDLGYDQDEEPTPIVKKYAHAIGDIEPLRFFRQATETRDVSAAFLQYYRVLEYYSTLTLQSDLSSLRANTSLSSRDFTVEVLKITGKDESALLARLITSIVPSSLLQRARRDGLCGSVEPKEFAAKLYEFRNSLVHAKYDFRSQFRSISILEDSKDVPTWRNVVAEIALIAIDTCGRQRT